MTERNPDSEPEEQDFEKRIKGLRTETLNAGLCIWSSNERDKLYSERMATAKTQEEYSALREEYEGGPMVDAESMEICNEYLDDPDEEARREAQADPAKTPSWLDSPEKVNFAQKVLALRRDQEKLIGDADSTLAKAPKLSIADFLSKYRSDLKRAIALRTLAIRCPSYLKVCRALDNDRALKLPPNWKKDSKDSSTFVQVYTDKSRTHLVENAICTVWAELREAGLMSRRSRSRSPETLYSK